MSSTNFRSALIFARCVPWYLFWSFVQVRTARARRGFREVSTRFYHAYHPSVSGLVQEYPTLFLSSLIIPRLFFLARRSLLEEITFLSFRHESHLCPKTG